MKILEQKGQLEIEDSNSEITTENSGWVYLQVVTEEHKGPKYCFSLAENAK